MNIPETSLEMDIGGNWELGVLFPIKNPNMELFEQFAELVYDVDINSMEIYVLNNARNKFKLNDYLIIGPSSDPTRDSNSNQIYYDKYEIFLINGILNIGNNIWKIFLKQLNADTTDKTLYAYLAGDRITIRNIARNWNYINNEFTGIDTYGSWFEEQDPSYFRRYDALDDMKGYSQLIQMQAPSLNNISIGIVQDVYDRSFLNRISGKNIRMSAWVRVGIREQAITEADDIDETTPVDNNDIDEGYGFLDQSGWTENDIDEQPSSGGYAESYPSIYLRSVYYSDPSYTNIVSNQIESYGPVSEGTGNVFMDKVFTLPEGILSGRVGLYATLMPNPRINKFDLLIDDIVLEHCIGTSKESDGFYKMDMNPSIGVEVKNKTTIATSKDALGIKSSDLSGDPNSRYIITATWLNMPGYFLEDMKVLEKWNQEGFPIILRTKMPGEIPYTLFCNMKLSSPEYEVGRGNQEANVTLEFEEIST